MSFKRNIFTTKPSTREKYLDIALAVVIGCILAIAVLDYFDVLTKG